MKAIPDETYGRRPDWIELPEWVKWVAMDHDGTWFCYAEPPRDEGESWYSGALGAEILGVVGNGNWWMDSLQARP